VGVGRLQFVNEFLGHHTASRLFSEAVPVAAGHRGWWARDRSGQERGIAMAFKRLGKEGLISDAAFGPLKKKRYSDQVAELIQKRIFEDHLEKGTGLPTEQAFAREFQVSRSVIREALRILEISGLVSIKKGPSGGIFVSNGYHRPIRKSLKNLVASGGVTIDHLFDVRLLIEPHIAKEAALYADESDTKKMEDLIQDSTLHLDDPVHLKKNNLNFHLLLARASGNPVFSILLESVFELLWESSLDFLDLDLERGFFALHQEIFRVIAERRPEEAERLVVQDILEVKERLKAFRGHEKGPKD